MRAWAIVISVFVILPFAAPANSKNWIANGNFSLWTGADYKSSCDVGHVSADAISIGPGVGGCTSSFRLLASSGYWLFLNLYNQPHGGQDPRTNRLTILEHHIADGGELAGKRVRLSFNVMTDRPMGLIPILWQNWRAGIYQIYTCETVTGTDHTWVHATCEMVLPYTTSIPLDGYYTGVGIDLEAPTEGLIILDDLKLVVIPR
jgi:hypothetical protein